MENRALIVLLMAGIKRWTKAEIVKGKYFEKNGDRQRAFVRKTS